MSPKHTLQPYISDQLKLRPYVELAFTLSPDTFEETAEQFISFTQLEERIKGQFNEKKPAYRRGKIGYCREEISEGSTDNKEYFHYSLHFEKLFKKEIEQCEDTLAQSLLTNLRKIHKKAMVTSTEIIRSFEPEYPGIQKHFFPKDKQSIFVLRVLKYPSQNQGAQIAKGHYDRGMFTLALGESTPGLRLGTGPDDLKEIKHKPHTALFMPAINLHTLTSEAYKPVWHDVIQKEKNSEEDPATRWAIVFFANTYQSNQQVSKEQAHTPLEY